MAVGTLLGTWRQWSYVVLGLGLAAVLSACTSGSEPADRPSSPAPAVSISASASPSPSSAVDAASQNALDAYVGLWQATARASHTSDWQDPEISRYASGDALQVVTGTLYADYLNNVVSRGEPVVVPEVTSVDAPDSPTTVLIADCGDDSNWLKYGPDGELVDGTPGGPRQITAEVQLHQDDVWRVTRFAVRSVGSC